LFSEIIYGADYNPEQWSEEVWLEDMRLMKKAGVNMVNIGIFSWGIIQSNEEDFDFEYLDKIMDLLHENGIKADLATGTAAQPAWVSKKYPDVLPVDAKGNTIWYGSRQTYCPNSPSYRRLSKALAEAMAERYKSHPALEMWHINNEYSDHTSVCYCETCAKQFRVWLEKRYGSLEAVNDAWGTNFWSQRYYDFEEIIPPRVTSGDHNPCQALDYKRFMSDSILECYMGEYEVLRAATPEMPITTNFMGNNNKPLDYFKWAENIDVISWDSYPDIAAKHNEKLNAFTHDLMRGLKGSKPFLMMEQAPNQVNWREHNPNKRPGVMGLYSYQAMARGADGIMFFQWRQSKKGAEKFHSGMITHTGDENSRVFKEVEKLGNELKVLKEIAGSKVKAEVAIVFDYDNWWAVEYRPGPSGSLLYPEQVRNFYDALYDLNITADIIPIDGDLDKYKVVIAPLMYMVKDGFKERVESFVANGGAFATSFFSGIVKENDEVFESGYPGPLSEVLGISIEEYDALSPDMKNGTWVCNADLDFSGDYQCDLWCDIIHLNEAKALAYFKEDYYAGYPAITENAFGEGKAYYIGTQIAPALMKKLMKHVCRGQRVGPVVKSQAGVEATVRESDGKGYLFVLNHNNEKSTINLPKGTFTNLVTGAEVTGTVKLMPKEIFIGAIDL